MKRLHLLLAVLALPFLMGMGALTGEVTPERIPVPQKKFAAAFTDNLDIVTDCTEVSIEGMTHLEGRRGEGKLLINFERIQQISFGRSGGRLMARVGLADGTSLEIAVDKEQKAYGRTAYGAFVIKLGELKLVQFAKTPVK